MNIGFAGIGRMGDPMVRRLLGAGLPVTVWNRTPERLSGVLSEGAVRAADLQELTKASDAVFTMVTDDAAVDQIYLGSTGLLAGDVHGKIFIDMSTVLPDTVKRIAKAVADKGGSFIDAPVAGTVQPAREGRLLVFAGGKAGDIQTLKPAFDAMARRVEVLGPVGSGAAMKLVHNALLSTHWAVLAEGLAMGSRYGLELKRMLDVIGESPASFAALAVKIPLLLGQPAEIGFNITNVRKDLRTIAAFAQSLDVPISVARSALRTYDEASQNGFGAEDVASIVAHRSKARDGEFEATVFVTSILGSTARGESRNILDTVSWSNAVLSQITEVALRFGGVPVKYMGDSFLGFFAGDNHRLRAVRAAVNVRASVSDGVVVALCSGPVLRTTIGHPSYAQPDIAGRTVNRAFRVLGWVQSNARGRIGATSEALQDLDEAIQIGDAYNISLKGIAEPVVIREVVGLRESK